MKVDQKEKKIEQKLVKIITVQQNAIAVQNMSKECGVEDQEIEKKNVSQQKQCGQSSGFRKFVRQERSLEQVKNEGIVAQINQLLYYMVFLNQKQNEEKEKQQEDLREQKLVQKKTSDTQKHREKNYNKNFIKSIGTKIIEYIKEQLPKYLALKNIINYPLQEHLSFISQENRMRVQFFKNLMNELDNDSQEIKQMKKINRILAFRYLKEHSIQAIMRKNKVIRENQSAYLLHSKILAKKLTNTQELDCLI